MDKNTSKTRRSGILMPISSLPSPYGIGALGREAFSFADFLCDAGQSVWQVLPIGPTGYGDSPYSSLSSYAGNPYFIDLDILCEEGLLDKALLQKSDNISSAELVDYGLIYKERFSILRAACKNLGDEDPHFLEFCEQNAEWISDFCLFMAIKEYFDMKSWMHWQDENIRHRSADAVCKYERMLADEIIFHKKVQYLFFKQWRSLKSYANKKGISILGDIPFYVAYDSADVWAKPEHYLLDENLMPKEVSGVPPDYFSVDGQYWGNPIYDWENLEKDKYIGFTKRVVKAAELYDMVRIDHFRGIESYWSIPWGSKTAKNGSWKKGPGRALIDELRKMVSKNKIIAEDLGILTEEVRELLKYSGYPGMKVLQFGLAEGKFSEHTPCNYNGNCICYTGTHDNNTLKGFLDTVTQTEINNIRSCINSEKNINLDAAIINCGMASSAGIFIAQMQDYLGLGEDSRTNIPGTETENWRWRINKEALSNDLAQKIKKLTEENARCPG